jgi:hypothetical protein
MGARAAKWESDSGEQMDRLLNVVALLTLLLLGMVLVNMRRAHIRVEYSVSWLAACVLMLVLSRSQAALEQVQLWLGLPDRPLALFMIASGVFLMVFYRFTLIISDLKDSNIALTQRIAILEYKLGASHEETKAD